MTSCQNVWSCNIPNISRSNISMTTENFLMVALYRDAIDIKDVKELNIEM